MCRYVRWHLEWMVRFISNFSLVLLLIVLTQIGGLAWLIALFFRRKISAFLLAYVALTAATVWIAPNFGRVALNCFDSGLLQVQSWMYCALSRNYVTPELREILVDSAEEWTDGSRARKPSCSTRTFHFKTIFLCCRIYLTMMVRRPISRFSTEMKQDTCPAQRDHQLDTLRSNLVRLITHQNGQLVGGN